MLLTKAAFRLRDVMSRIWVKLAAYSVLALATALAAVFLGPILPSDLDYNLGADAIEPVLTIIASSMLAVSTFSLGIMASAIADAARNATPRATSLLLEDRTSQNVVATFLGAFIYALVGLIALKIGIYDNGGRMILMAATILVIVLIYAAFIGWINQLRVFGRIPDTLDRVEEAACKALAFRVENPYLGCNRLDGTASAHRANDTPVHGGKFGYVRHIDLPHLQELATTHDLLIVVNRPPGRYATPAQPVALIRDGRKPHPEIMKEISDCFDLGTARTFDQDPQFGMIVLAETASHALSSAVNDPGTAIDILRRAVRLLADWRERADPELRHDRIWVAPLSTADMLVDLIRPIARDGAALVEVQHILQTSLADLAELAPDIFAEAARVQSREALERAEAALTLEVERAEIRALAARLDQPASSGSRRLI